MITIFLIAFPIIAGLIALLLKGETVKRFAFLLSLVELVATLYAVSQFNPTGTNPSCSV